MSSDSNITLPLSALESLSSGFLKVRRDGAISYADPTFCDLAGIPSWEGRNVRELLDEENRAVVERQIEQRFTAGTSAEYPLTLTRADDARTVSVWVTAMPELDDRGHVVESIVLIRDQRMELASEAIHAGIDSRRNYSDLLEMVAQETREIVPYDWFIVALYSADMDYSSELFSYPPEARVEWPVRWFETPKMGRHFLEQKHAMRIDDIEAWLDQPDWQDVKNDPVTQQFLELGYRSLVWFPVVGGDRIVASVTLYRHGVRPFEESESKALQQLPLRRAVSMSLYYKERESYELRLDLINRISRESRQIRNIGKIIVDEVAKFYQWENVSLFGVDEHRAKLVLLSQKGVSDAFMLDDDYEQDLDEGVAGHVYASKTALNIGDVNQPPYDQIVKRVYLPAVSELCIPIILDGRVVALLNVEDTHKNAFVEDEMRELEAILMELSSVFERQRILLTLKAILDSIRDVIIVTDSKGRVTQANPATESLLGYGAPELVGTAFQRYLTDGEMAQHLVKAGKLTPQEIAFVAKDGDEKKLLLSASPLPEEIGGTVYVGVDLTQRRSAERIELLHDLLHEIAAQTQTPLSLVAGWLHSMKKSATGHDLDVLDKALRQLAKIEVGFDRLLLFEREGTTVPYNELLLDMVAIAHGVLDELPRRESQDIDFASPESPLMVRGDLFQLSFCIRSILSYLLPFASEDEPIRITLERDGPMATVTITGRSPRISGHEARSYADQAWIARTVTQMRLGEGILRSLVESNLRGRWCTAEHRGDRLTLGFALRLAEERGSGT